MGQQGIPEMNMREKIARAMFAVGAKRMGSKKTWDTCEQSYRDLMLAETDAALDELLVPTDAMVDAAEWSIDCLTEDGLPQNVSGCDYMNAIRAAKEGK